MTKKAKCTGKSLVNDPLGKGYLTVECQLPKGHKGPHDVTFEISGPVQFTWSDEIDKSKNIFEVDWKEMVIEEVFKIIRDTLIEENK